MRESQPLLFKSLGAAAFRTARSSFAGSIFVRAGTLALGFVVTTIVARLLGPGEYGRYVFALMIVTLVAVPMQSGLATLVVREVARASAEEAWGRVRGIRFFSNAGVTAMSLLAVFTGAGVLMVRGGGSSLWLWSGLLLPLICLATLRDATLRGLGRVVIGQLSDGIVRPVCLGALALVWLVDSHTATAAMKLHVFAASVAFVVGAVLTHFALSGRSRSAVREYRSREWLRSLGPFSLIAGVQVANASVGILLLKVLASDVDIAHYRIAELGGTLVLIGMIAGEMVLAPRIATLYAANQVKTLQRQIISFTRAMLLSAVAVASVGLLFGEFFIATLIGVEYLPAFSAFAIVAVAQTFNSATGAVGSLMTMTGHEAVVLGSLVLALLVNLVVDIALVPDHGAVGAATGLAASIVTWNVLLTYRAWRLTGIRSLPW